MCRFTCNQGSFCTSDASLVITSNGGGGGGGDGGGGGGLHLHILVLVHWVFCLWVFKVLIYKKNHSWKCLIFPFNTWRALDSCWWIMIGNKTQKVLKIYHQSQNQCPTSCSTHFSLWIDWVLIVKKKNRKKTCWCYSNKVSGQPWAFDAHTLLLACFGKTQNVLEEKEMWCRWKSEGRLFMAKRSTGGACAAFSDMFARLIMPFFLFLQLT